eukprot:TRINITY_DN102544_c0_g1_i1.p1 TRINITY_DN102544_c0_g1~~TRINITY_DN102544_c0_g1_i1.p1  ORF type:complete len:315 (-),score=58.41 TRINITY_DN102544_c0_g1_i1:104-1006(-)
MASIKQQPGQVTVAGDSEEISSSVDFVAGGLVSAISKVAVYPMETKVLLIAIGESAANDSSRLWHGVGVKGIENFLYNGLLWALKEKVRPPPPDPAQPENRPPASFLAAFLVSCVCILLAHPLSNTVHSMQASLRNVGQQPLSAMQAARGILQKQGLGGFFTGWQLSVALRIGSALTLVVYDVVRSWTKGVLGSDASNFVAGLLGRLSEVYLMHPVKTLRYRLQQGQTMLPSLSPSALAGLWAGAGTMALADAIKIGIRFGLIERLRVLLQRLLIAKPGTQLKSKVDEEGMQSDQRMIGG